MTADEPPFDPDYDTPPTSGAAPSDLEAERAVLACLLYDPNLTPTLATHLNPGDFWRPAHEEIWNTIHALHHEGTTPDPILVNTRLLDTGKHDAAKLLPDIVTTTVSPANADAYAKRVRDCSRLRAVDQVATSLRDIVTRGRAGLIDHHLTTALDTVEQAYTRWGPTNQTGARTGLVDMAWVLDGEPPPQPQPTYGLRTDGTALFYPGKVNGIFGDPEAAKTWLAQVAIIEALNAGGTAAMIDADHNGPNHTAARLALLGARLEDIADPTRFRYYEPEDAEQLRGAVDDITRHAPDIVLIDSLGEVFPMLGVNTNDGDEMSTAMRQVCTRPATAGSCVITIDHLPKSHDARATGFAIGSIAKKRMVRGSYLRAEARTQPAPGQIGRITLRIEKDTIGELRRSSGGGYAGTFTLDSTEPHITKWQISRDEAPTNSDGTFRPTKLMEAISRYVEDNDQCTQNDILDDVPGKSTYLRAALKLLVHEGFISALPGPRNSRRHHSIALYREAEDDNAQPQP